MSGEFVTPTILRDRCSPTPETTINPNIDIEFRSFVHCPVDESIRQMTTSTALEAMVFPDCYSVTKDLPPLHEEVILDKNTVTVREETITTDSFDLRQSLSANQSKIERKLRNEVLPKLDKYESSSFSPAFYHPDPQPEPNLGSKFLNQLVTGFTCIKLSASYDTVDSSNESVVRYPIDYPVNRIGFSRISPPLTHLYVPVGTTIEFTVGTGAIDPPNEFKWAILPSPQHERSEMYYANQSDYSIDRSFGGANSFLSTYKYEFTEKGPYQIGCGFPSPKGKFITWHIKSVSSDEFYDLDSEQAWRIIKDCLALYTAGSISKSLLDRTLDLAASMMESNTESEQVYEFVTLDELDLKELTDSSVDEGDRDSSDDADDQENHDNDPPG